MLVLFRLARYFTDTFRLVYSFTEGLFAFVVSLGFDGRDYFSCLGIWPPLGQQNGGGRATPLLKGGFGHPHLATLLVGWLLIRTLGEIFLLYC
jgi:hypothetical protein